MRNLFILLLATTFIAISSNGKSMGNTPDNAWKFDSLTVSKRVYVDNDETKDGMLIDLNFVYPVSVSGNLNLKEIQNIFACIIVGKPDFRGTPHEAMNKVQADYTADAEELAGIHATEDSDFPHFSNYEYNRSSKISMETESLVTASIYDYTYTGGAHGLYGVSYYNIDKKTGTLIKEEQLFVPGYKDKLAVLIQNEISRRNNLHDDEEEIGLLVDLQDVGPNDNFYFGNEGIVYVYNIYEITPYAQGIVEITIPYDQVTPLVNKPYLSVIRNLRQELK
ncbi:DUF3298 domain-containing protein [Dysgonomonas sp. 521]|uniref:DUF3298 and DUF4163 domain-containing protein n=1 Tax=Dysgonomonas sp. 521 TaxID=2302932 RepID=UPI0013D11A12|nr:DUF3298 and DUF4163 domain-containing protein [Dysgonomonas sp. 521]NDV94672.1 DUF3298 domain-containing protein [Dysgonomonas sp. 521]